ncbi:phage integrase N-terminal SAM-like domain-containing protein [Pseudoalteromonas agarivorans]|uniref:phage integrase N-terminal SAM-like domain-containing protein n=1 Tax=Pseudoalteromonas agarivorans TaxID=176102 RepID=UPI0030844806
MKSSFLTMIAEQMYLKRYAKSTIKAYLYWIASFIRFNPMMHPTTMGNNEAELILTHLVNQKKLLLTLKPSLKCVELII